MEASRKELIPLVTSFFVSLICSIITEIEISFILSIAGLIAITIHLIMNHNPDAIKGSDVGLIMWIEGKTYEKVTIMTSLIEQVRSLTLVNPAEESLGNNIP